MKQETCGAGGVYLSSGREKSGFRRVDFDVRPNQISEKVAVEFLYNLRRFIYVIKGFFNITRDRV